ncbi:MAG: hypothetical protein ABEH43_03010 [Flavobacteriales bacterium]
MINIDQDGLKEKLMEIKEHVDYTGSPDHKDNINELIEDSKRPSPRPDASMCPNDIKNKSEVVKWLKEAIGKGAVSEMWEGKYPKYVWYYDKEREMFFIGRLTNKIKGKYKGFPITEEECPKNIRSYYE